MMTRKRFIKLMMAQGYTRNQCEGMANGVVKTGYSYRETYNLAMGFRSLWPKVYIRGWRSWLRSWGSSFTGYLNL